MYKSFLLWSLCWVSYFYGAPKHTKLKFSSVNLLYVNLIIWSVEEPRREEGKKFSTPTKLKRHHSVPKCTWVSEYRERRDGDHYLTDECNLEAWASGDNHSGCQSTWREGTSGPLVSAFACVYRCHCCQEYIAAQVLDYWPNLFLAFSPPHQSFFCCLFIFLDNISPAIL